MTVPADALNYIGEDLVFAFRATDTNGNPIPGLDPVLVATVVNPNGDVLAATVVEPFPGDLPGLYEATVAGADVDRSGRYYCGLTDPSATLPGVRTSFMVVSGQRPDDASASLPSGDRFEAYDAVTLSFEVEVADVTAYTENRVFTAKVRPSDLDADAVVTIWETGGLTVLSGAPPVAPITAADGQLFFLDATTARVSLTARAMEGLGRGAVRGLCWDIQAFNAADPPAKIVAKAGTLQIVASKHQGQAAP